MGERKHNKTVRGKLRLGKTKTQELRDMHEKMQQLVTIKMDNVRKAKIWLPGEQGYRENSFTPHIVK